MKFALVLSLSLNAALLARNLYLRRKRKKLARFACQAIEEPEKVREMIATYKASVKGGAS